MKKTGPLFLAGVLLAAFVVLRQLERSFVPPPPPPAAKPVQPVSAPDQPIEPVAPVRPPDQGMFGPGPTAVEQAPVVATQRFSTLPSEEKCRALVPFSDLLTALPNLDQPSFDSIMPDLAASLTCRAAAFGSEAVCGQAAGIKAASLGRGVDEMCAGSFRTFHPYEALARRNAVEAAARCVKDTLSVGMFASNAPKACKIMMEAFLNGDRPEDCEKLVELIPAGLMDAHGQAWSSKRFIEACKSAAGRERDCGALPKNEKLWRFACDSQRNIMTAARNGGSSALCGDNPICTALFSRSPAACAPREVQTVESYCKIKVDQELKALTLAENDFRKENGLPKWKSGDPVYHQLPPQERAKFEKPKKADGRMPKAAGLKGVQEPKPGAAPKPAP